MVYIIEGDHFVSESQRRTAEILADFYPNLQLQFIPIPERRGTNDYNFRVVDTNPGGEPYVVCFSEEADERLLAQVFRCDNTRRDLNTYLDAYALAQEVSVAKAEKEARMEDHHIAASILRSRKINYMHNGINWGQHNGGRAYERR